MISNVKNYKLNEYLIKTHNINNPFNKLILIQGIQFILFGFMLLFFILGYNNQYNTVNVQNIPEKISAYRGVSIFFACWYIVIYLFSIKNINSINNFRTLKIFLILSFIPIFNVITIGFLASKMQFTTFKLWFKNLFKGDDELLLVYNYKNWIYKLNLCLAIIMSPIVIIAFCQIGDTISVYPINGIGEKIKYSNLWFVSLHYFTIQTNLLCFLYLVLFLIKPNLKLFKYNTFLMSCIVYIFVVGITYDFALLPMKILKNDLNDWNWYKYFCNIYEHFINPILFVSFGLIIICKQNKISKLNTSLLNHLVYSMIIPTIYLIYALVLPFVSNVSVYGFVTNCNPNVYNEIIVNNQTDFMSKGNPLCSLFIFSYWLLFLGLLTGIYYINLKYIKININEQKCY